MQTHTLEPFLNGVDRAYIVEHNFNGQYTNLIREAMPELHAKLKPVLKFDGLSFLASDILRAVEGA